MEGALPRSGHSYFGVVSSAQEAHAVLEASKLGLLPRVTRRLTDEERLRFVRAGAVFVWEEEEAGIRRWTDHIKWSPSRVSGAFLTYTEVPSRGDDSLVKQSFSSVDAGGTKMHLIAYTSKSAATNSSLPAASRDPLVQRMLAQRSSGGRDPRETPLTLPIPPPLPPPSQSHTPYPYPHPSQSATAGPSSWAYAQPPPSYPPPPPHHDFRHSQSSHFDPHDPSARPRSSSAAADRERPSTSSSEPRSSSSYDSYAARSAAHPHSNSYPSFGGPPPSRNPYPSSSLPPSMAPSPVLLPPIAGSPRPWPFAYDAGAAGPSSSSTSAARFPAFMPSPAPSLSPTLSAPSSNTSAPPQRPSTATTTASPFDPYPRQLPPLHSIPPSPPMGLAEGPPPRYLLSAGGVVPTGMDEEERRGAHDGPVGHGHERTTSLPRSATRGSEDERQLRLLRGAM